MGNDGAKMVLPESGDKLTTGLARGAHNALRGFRAVNVVLGMVEPRGGGEVRAAARLLMRDIPLLLTLPGEVAHIAAIILEGGEPDGEA